MTTKFWLFLLLLFLLLIVLGTIIYGASYLLNPGQPPPTVNVTLPLTSTDTPMPPSTPTDKPMDAPTLTPTLSTTHPSILTPLPSEKVVKGFLILAIAPEGRAPITVKPDTTITTTVEKIVRIKAELSTTHEEQVKDLVFTWHTCCKGTEPVVQRIGNPEMLYVAPSEPGPDCICVAVGVEKGGALFDRKGIFVDVQRPP